MSSREKAIDDIARVAGGAIGVLSNAGREAKETLKSKMDVIAQEMDLVSRSELERLEIVIEELSKKNKDLETRIADLESK